MVNTVKPHSVSLQKFLCQFSHWNFSGFPNESLNTSLDIGHHPPPANLVLNPKYADDILYVSWFIK